jgi:alpha-galactosidase
MPIPVTLRRTRYGVTIANAWLTVSCHLARGVLSFRDVAGGGTVLREAGASVELGDGRSVSSVDRGFDTAWRVEETADVLGSGLTLRLSRPPVRGEPELRLSVTVYDSQPVAVLQIELMNTASSPLAVRAFRLDARPALGRSPRRWRFYKQPWQHWSETKTVVGPYALTEDAGLSTSDLVGLVSDTASGRSVLLGFVTAADQLSQVRMDAASRHLIAVSYADGVSVQPGASLTSERLLVDVSGPPLDSLARYGQALGRCMGARAWPHVPSGWCSWYYYWWNIDEEKILANLAFLGDHRRELPVEYVQIDDGYQAGIGDWTTVNEKFPHGLAWLAQRIHDKGFKTGLWLAPLLVGAKSTLYRDHPDWVIRSSDGGPVIALNNWGQDCYGLDCTHPDAQAWLRRTIETVSSEWGFDYLKLDFLFGATMEGVRHDPAATRAQAYRRGVEILRQAAGDRLLMACIAPVGATIGLFEACRIGPDVAPAWRMPWPGAPLCAPGTENALRTSIARYWMHGNLWANDADCLLVRDSENALTLDETRFLATVIALSGGMVFLSDDMLKLSPERLQVAGLLLPPYGRSAVPLDLMERFPPSALRLEVERPFERYWLQGVLHWGDAPADVVAPLPDEPVHVFDLWEERYFGVQRGQFTFEHMAPHSAKLLSLRPVRSEPQVVSSTFHFSQGAAEIEDARFDPQAMALTVRLVRPARGQGEILIHVPDGYRESASGGLESDVPAEMSRRADGLLAVRLTLEERAQFTVRFQ